MIPISNINPQRRMYDPLTYPTNMATDVSFVPLLLLLHDITMTCRLK